MNNEYQELELNEVLNRVASYCDIDANKENILKEEISYNPLLIERRLALGREAINILKEGIFPDFSSVIDITAILNKTLKGITLTSSELRKCITFHFALVKLNKELRQINIIDLLNDYLDSLFLATALFSELDKLVDQDGNIKKDASKHLKELFDQRQHHNYLLNEKAQNFLKDNHINLQEDSLYYRNDRLTFLVKNNAKNKFGGYRYGDSQSKQASYIEPQEFVEMNNRRNLDNELIEQEIKKILKDASKKISSIAFQYINNFNSLAELDLIFAKAKYGYQRKGIYAKLLREGELYLKNIHHPLIAENKSVANTYCFYAEYKGIVISGSNTGGKTVALKTIALAIILTYLGIPLFAEEANIPLYNHLFIDLQDNQSIKSSLSSFSAHLTKLNNIIKQADRNSLVLIDEIGTGTDPKEAEALSLAIIKYLIKYNIPFILTTHYDEIKKYAYHNPLILLSSVGFDLNKLMPTYHYHENSLGQSNALKIAANYLDNNDIIADAYAILENNRSAEEKLLAQLNREKSANEAKALELAQAIEDNEKLHQQLKQEKEEFEKNIEKEKEKVNLKLLDYYENKRQEIDRLSKQIIQTKHKKEYQKEFDKLKPETQKEKIIFKTGDRVRVKGNERAGYINELNKDRAKVNIGGINIDIGLNDLELLPPINKTNIKTREVRKSFSSVPGEINLIGKTVQEALDLVDKYLDEAKQTKRSSVRLIHGYGSLALRNAIRLNLSKDKSIKAYHDADYNAGGGAVTVVELK